MSFGIVRRISSRLALVAAVGLIPLTTTTAQGQALLSSSFEDAYSVNLAKESTLGIVDSTKRGIRDDVYYFFKRRGMRPSQPGTLVRRFSGEPESTNPFASANDPFAALGYAKGMPTKAPPLAAPDTQGWLFSVWGQGASDHEERRTGFVGAPSSATTISNTAVVGADAVKIGVSTSSDAFVIGGFYTNTSSHSGFTTPGISPFNSRSVTEGGGVYASYIAGGFSTDMSFLYSDTGSRFSAGVPRDTDTWNLAFNIQYKFDLSQDWWVEPTVGFAVTKQHGNSPAAGFPLTDGGSHRFQGGVRVGTEWATNWAYGTIRVQPTLAGYAYSDVDVEVIRIVGSTFIGSTDQGYLWGKGIGKVNVQWTDKFSTSLEGEIRHRADVDAYAYRLMARYTF